jgi:hypothetical protein
MATQRGIAVDNRVHDSDFDDCDALLEGRMGEGWHLFFQTADVQVLAPSAPRPARPAPARSPSPHARASTPPRARVLRRSVGE